MRESLGRLGLGDGGLGMLLGDRSGESDGSAALMKCFWLAAFWALMISIFSLGFGLSCTSFGFC